MRVVIAGSRQFNDYILAENFLDINLSKLKDGTDLTIISGGCRGADSIGERYALENGIKTELYPAEWKLYGKRAGPIRNRKMVNECDAVICFWDGKSRGTKSLIEYAKSKNKILLVKIINDTI